MSNPFLLTPEQEALRSLRGLVVDVYEGGDVEAARQLPVIAYRVASSAVDRRSPRLLQNSLDIWPMQLALLERTSSPAVRRSVADLVAEMSSYTLRSLSARLEDRFRSLSNRVSVVPFLSGLRYFRPRR